MDQNRHKSQSVWQNYSENGKIAKKNFEICKFLSKYTKSKFTQYFSENLSSPRARSEKNKHERASGNFIRRKVFSLKRAKFGVFA